MELVERMNMKLKTVKNSLSTNGYRYEIKDDFLIVYSKEKWKTQNRYKMAAQVSLTEVNHLRTYVDDEFLLDLFYQFSITPLAERSDDNPYYIQINNKVLAFVRTNDISVGFNPIALASSTVTQAQIDNFPQEIKDAIECGFLIKIEAK